MVLIGLVGINRVGKDTLAEILTKEYKFKQYALADPIKKVAKILFDFDDAQLSGCKKEEIDPRWNISPRQFYQSFGTEIMQYGIYKYLPNLIEKVQERFFWVVKMENWVDQQRKIGNINIVISDIRFVHEASSIRRLGGVLLQITRNNAEYDVEDVKTDGTYNHSSQIQINDIPSEWIDYHIKNDTNLEEYIKEINNIIPAIII